VEVSKFRNVSEFIVHNALLEILDNKRNVLGKSMLHLKSYPNGQP